MTREIEFTYEEADAICKAMKRLNLYADTCEIPGFWNALRKVRSARDDMAAVFAQPEDTPEIQADIFSAGEAA